MSAGAAESEHQITTQVRTFYEKFQFPTVRPLDQDGLILLRQLAQRFAEAKRQTAHARVLDAGCGTGNTVISLARRFKDVDFLGVDVSSASLAVAQREAGRTHLGNVRFLNWDLMKSGLNGGPFEVILCLGVLHHVADMKVVLSNLRAVMNEETELYLWIYGRHGRYRHSLNRCLLDMLLHAQGDSHDSVSLAREFALCVGGGTVLEDLFGPGWRGSMRERVMEEPAWIADQFMHPHEVLLSMEELLSLASEVDLEVDRWLGLPEDPNRCFGSDVLAGRFRALSRHRQLVALDLLLKPERYFVTLLRPRGAKRDSP